ncbi:MAG: RsmE family RNA methyltransferase [bacterium]|nr:RsmE family RNA methyltransferase [bacterium]
MGSFIMKIHRFIGNFNLKIGYIEIKDPELLNQFRNVLKLKIGERVTLCDGKINEGVAEIKEYGKDYIEVEIKEVNTNKNEPEIQVILYCAILKRENFELVVQKATEIGIKEIVPIITERTVKLDIRKDRLEKIIREAAEQSGRGIVPVLREPIDFDRAVSEMDKNSVKIFFDQSGQIDRHHKTVNQPSVSKVGIFIGPEGGWTSKEIETARTAGFEILSLGKTTLRAETAAIIGSYLAINNTPLSEI